MTKLINTYMQHRNCYLLYLSQKAHCIHDFQKTFANWYRMLQKKGNHRINKWSVLSSDCKQKGVDQFHFTIFMVALILYGLYALMIESVAVLWLIMTDWCQDLSLGTHLLAKQIHSVECQQIYCGWYACWLASHRVIYRLCLWQCLKLSQKSCRSSWIESQIINLKLKNNQQNVPGRPPKMSASDWQTCGNSNWYYMVWLGLFSM